LPKDESKVSPNGPITKKETLDFKKKLENKDSLKELMEGYVPGGTILPDETE
jgi:hypothetical protein